MAENEDVVYTDGTDENGGVYTRVVSGLADEDAAYQAWYVWRRSDGLVGITNVAPTEAFITAHAYHVLLITTSYNHAHYEGVLARLVN